MPGIAASQSRASSGGSVAQELERIAAAVGPQGAQRGRDARRLLVGQAAGPDDVGQLGERRGFDGRPVGRGQVRQADAAPAGQRARFGRGAVGRRGGRIAVAEGLERDLGVEVGAVGREDREDQLADGVEAGLPGGPAVCLREAVEDEGDQPGPFLRACAPRRARPARAGLAGAVCGRVCAAGLRAGLRPGGFGLAAVAGLSGFGLMPAKPGVRPTRAPTATSRASRSPAAATSGAALAMASRRAIGRSTTGNRDAPQRIEGRGPFRRDAAADRQARNAGGRGAPGHAQGRLAEGGLGVDLALARDDQVGPGQTLVEARLEHHQFDAGDQFERSQTWRQAHQTEARPAGGPGAGQVAGAHAGRRLEQIGVVRQPGLESGHVLRPGALLRGVDRGRALIAEEWIGDVAGDAQTQLAEPRVQVRQVQGGQVGIGPGSAGRSRRGTAPRARAACRSRRPWWRCRPRP